MDRTLGPEDPEFGPRSGRFTIKKSETVVRTCYCKSGINLVRIGKLQTNDEFPRALTHRIPYLWLLVMCALFICSAKGAYDHFMAHLFHFLGFV